MIRLSAALAVLCATALISGGCDYLALIDVENRSSVAIIVDPGANRPQTLQPGEKAKGINGRINRHTTLIVTNAEDPADVQTRKFSDRARALVVVTGPPLTLTVTN